MGFVMFNELNSMTRAERATQAWNMSEKEIEVSNQMTVTQQHLYKTTYTTIDD
jgi:hypothetical protein